MIFKTLKSEIDKVLKMKKPETITLVSGVDCFVIIANREWLKHSGKFLICGHNWSFWDKDKIEMICAGVDNDCVDELKMDDCNFLVLSNEKRELAESQLNFIWKNNIDKSETAPVKLLVFLKCDLCEEPLKGVLRSEMMESGFEFVVFVERCDCKEVAEEDKKEELEETILEEMEFDFEYTAKQITRLVKTRQKDGVKLGGVLVALSNLVEKCSVSKRDVGANDVLWKKIPF